MYGELAEHYDRTYSAKDYAGESMRLREVIERTCPGARTLLDVACGTGGHLVHLRDHYECEGLDLSPDMVRLAREKLPGVPVNVASMTDFDLGRRFDVVACLFSSVGHLVTVDRLNESVSRMAEHLAPDGVLVIEPWIRPEDWIAGHLSMDTYEDDDVKLSRISISEPIDRGRVVMDYLVGTKTGVKRIRDQHDMGWFTDDEYGAAFEQAGLEVEFEPGGLTGRGLYVGSTSSG